MKKNVIVVSHRRSGTHLLLDTLRHNFQFKKESYLNLDQVGAYHKNRKSVAWLREQLESGSQILKTHSHYDIQKYFNLQNQEMSFVNSVFDDSQIIYIYRDFRDVVISLYHYIKSYKTEYKDISLGEFIHQENNYDTRTYEGEMSRLEYWSYHILSWVDNRDDILCVRYSDLYNNYSGVVDRLETYLNVPRCEDIYDARITKRIGMVGKIKNILSGKNTHIAFRQGKPGDYKKHFSKSDLDNVKLINEKVLKICKNYAKS